MVQDDVKRALQEAITSLPVDRILISHQRKHRVRDQKFISNEEIVYKGRQPTSRPLRKENSLLHLLAIRDLENPHE